MATLETEKKKQLVFYLLRDVPQNIYRPIWPDCVFIFKVKHALFLC